MTAAPSVIPSIPVATQPAPEPARAGARVSIAQMRPGQVAVVCESDLPPADRRLLRAMGLRNEAPIAMCRRGEPCIVRVMGACACASRIGISRHLAERVFVRVGSEGAAARHD